ncbi:hypothetical protein DFP72DRAFT_1138465 [Ephemerocybe angulata]|uniref:Uncharacterized protein n=1 Tax=Ephemerocybe angulata TaxID=980116 RepID=A0A8H6HSB3_9AGAR|nr:hypothetical protein DFP72DRAFT_1138465 [Tulosesus angulatus]
MGLSTKKKSAKAATASKKVGLSKAERESKLLTAAASKAEKENTNPTPQKAKKTGAAEVSIDHAAFRKWVLEQDPRCELVDEENVRCKTCNLQDIKLENVYYLTNWFKHVKRKVHQDREEKWAKKANVPRASLRTETPEMSDFFATKYVTKKVSGETEPALTGKAVKSWIKEMNTFPSVHPSLCRSALPPLGVECQCTSTPDGCEHGPLSFCEKGAKCTLVLCAYHRGDEPSSGGATSVPRALCILRV